MVFKCLATIIASLVSSKDKRKLYTRRRKGWLRPTVMSRLTRRVISVRVEVKWVRKARVSGGWMHIKFGNLGTLLCNFSGELTLLGQMDWWVSEGMRCEGRMGCEGGLESKIE